MTLKVAELFAGIGAWSKALKKLGVEYEVVEAIEFDKKTIHSYNLIHGTKFNSKDITQLNANEFPDHDLLFYSPPCQAFSVAGKQEGFADEKGRGTLFFDALRIIQAKKPKLAIMENVKGLTQKKFAFEFETMIQVLEQEGYKNYWQVLNAKDYGIPQNRERVFIVSIREDLDKSYDFPKSFDSGLRLKDLLEDEVEDKYYLKKTKDFFIMNSFDQESKGNGFRFSPHVKANAQIAKAITTKAGSRMEDNYIIDNVNSDENVFEYSTKNKIIQLGLLDIKGNESIRRVYSPDGIAPTLSTMQGGNRQPKVALQDHQIRKLTPLECFRLMGFEDEDYYKLKNENISNSQIYKVAGNSVVVNVIEEILKELIPEYIASSNNTYQVI